MDKNARKRNRLWCSGTTSLAPLAIKVKRVERKRTSNEKCAAADISESDSVKTENDDVSNSIFHPPVQERTPEKAACEAKDGSPIIGGRFQTSPKSPVLCKKNLKIESHKQAPPEMCGFDNSQSHNFDVTGNFAMKSLSPVIGNRHSMIIIDKDGSPDIFASQPTVALSPLKHFVIEDVSSEDEVCPNISSTQSSQETAKPSISFTQVSHESANPTIEDVSTQEMLNSDYEGCRRADIDVDFVLYSKKPNRERLKAGGFAEKNRKLAALRRNFAEIWKHELHLSKTEQYPFDESQVLNFFVCDLKHEFNCAMAICTCGEKQSLVLLNQFVNDDFQIGKRVCVYPPFKVKTVLYEGKNFCLYYNIRNCSVK